VSKTVADYLNVCPPLKKWEQLAIIFHSEWCWCPLEKKRLAYEEMLREPDMDGVTAWHLRRLLRKFSYWLNAPERDAVPGRFFIAQSSIGELRTDGKVEWGRQDVTSYFSTYRRAKHYLDTLRKEAQKSGVSLWYGQTIREVLLDKNVTVERYFLDENGFVTGTDYTNHPSVKFHLPEISGVLRPECRYVDLGDPFSYGDIVTWNNGRETLYGVCASRPSPLAQYQIESFRRARAESPHLFKKSARIPSSPFEGCDYTDISEVVLTFKNDDFSTHYHVSTWELDRFDGDLPQGQEFLMDVSLHMKGVKPLSPELIKSYYEASVIIEKISDFDYPRRDFARGYL